jgi:hypothetical protein
VTTAEDIRSRGHVVFTIRPGTFDPGRVPLTELESILRRCAVQLRGWDVPHIDPQVPLLRKADRVEQASDWKHHLEQWSFYSSGQLADLSNIRYDWLDQYDPHLVPPGWQPGHALPVTDTVFTITEIFELAARLAFTPAGDEQMEIAISYRGLSGRVLVVDDNRRAPFFQDYRYDDETVDVQRSVTREQLASEAWDLAAAASGELFSYFGWEPAIEVIKGAQSELRGPARRAQT